MVSFVKAMGFFFQKSFLVCSSNTSNPTCIFIPAETLTSRGKVNNQTAFLLPSPVCSGNGQTFCKFCFVSQSEPTIATDHIKKDSRLD